MLVKKTPLNNVHFTAQELHNLVGCHQLHKQVTSSEQPV